MPNFASFAASIAELAHGEKSHTQSPSLFDAPGTGITKITLPDRCIRD